MKNIIIITILLTSCTPKEVAEVNIVGELRAIMRENKTEANINLLDLKEEEHLYALGALEGLAGEVLIMDSNPMISKVKGDSFAIVNNYDAKATLLVYTQVKDWDSFDINEDLMLGELEEFVNEKAMQAKLAEPIPFLVKGTASKLNWHIVNGSPGANATHEDHASSGFNREWNDAEVEILGFYSQTHHGVMTHHGENSHLHFLSRNGSATGHVDEVLIKKGSFLFIPKSY
ncbi:MAG: acetolactate decarboxylase [Cyclobacteriaceae bacterium]